MTWTRFDDSFPDHPKVIAVGPEGKALQVTAACYSSKYLTDGELPGQVARHLASTCTVGATTVDELIDRMVEHGLWETTGAGYAIHDYLAYNPARSKVLAERAAKSAGGKRGADTRWGASDGLSNGSTHTASHSGTHRRVDAPVPVPVPVPGTPSQPRSQKKESTATQASRQVDLDGEDEVTAGVARWFRAAGLLDSPTMDEVRHVVAEFEVDDPAPVTAALEQIARRGKANGRSGVEILSYLTSNSNGAARGSLLGRFLDDDGWQQVLDHDEAVRAHT
jgi:hypothetical protein